MIDLYTLLFYLRLGGLRLSYGATYTDFLAIAFDARL